MRKNRNIAGVTPILSNVVNEIRYLSGQLVAGALLGLIVSCSIAPQASTEPAATPPSNSSFNKVEDAIKPEGWTIPILQGEKREKTRRKEKQADGTDLWVTAISFSPTTRVVADLPPPDGDTDWMITDVTEFSFKSARLFVTSTGQLRT